VLSVDRRSDVRSEVVAELADLVATVRGLEADVVDEAAFEEAPDDGTFRDFVQLAEIRHGEREVLDWVVEELVGRFGWQADFDGL